MDVAARFVTNESILPHAWKTVNGVLGELWVAVAAIRSTIVPKTDTDKDAFKFYLEKKQKETTNHITSRKVELVPGESCVRNVMRTARTFARLRLRQQTGLSRET